MNVYTEFLYWGFLGLINLAVSILIYHSTKLERKQKLAAEYGLSTRPITAGISLPSSFTYLSCFTGLLNFGGTSLRIRQIHFLEIPTIPWLAYLPLGSDGDELLELLEAKWLVATNDWTSLFLAFTFFAAGCFNFATVRQLRMRDQWVKEVLLPRPRMALDEKMVFAISERDLLLGNDLNEKANRGVVMVEVGEEEQEKGRSFAVFSPLCAKRTTG